MKKIYCFFLLLCITLSSYAQVIQLPEPQKISCMEIISHSHYDHESEKYVMDNNYIGEIIVFNYGKNKITVIGNDYFIDTNNVSFKVDGEIFIYKYPITNRKGERGVIYNLVSPGGVSYIVICGRNADLYDVKDLQ